MSNPRGWTTDTYLRTAYNAGVSDFLAGNSIKDNLYNNKSLREMWEKGWKFGFERAEHVKTIRNLEEMARAQNLMNNPNEPTD